MNHREVVHKVFYAFPCISLVHEVLHSAFTSTEGAVVYAGFLVRVLFKSTFVWRFGHVSLCVVLVDVTCVCIQLTYYGLFTDVEVVT